MSEHSQIAWCEATWNPILGCSKVSSGCAHCYAVRQVHRMAANPIPALAAANAGLTAYHRNGQLDWTGVVRVVEARLAAPLHWRRPRRIFVNSLGDLFHPAVPDAVIWRVWGVMAAAPQHQFQVLTKHPDRMGAVLGARGAAAATWGAARRYGVPIPRDADPDPDPWPLANVWVGTSIEDQAAAAARLPFLAGTPAAVRFLSCEPLLGPLDLTPWLGALATPRSWLHWVICGGESGRGARPMEEAWAADLRGQCDAAGIPFFFKQAGVVLARRWGCRDAKGEDPRQWPGAFHRRQYPEPRSPYAAVAD